MTFWNQVIAAHVKKLPLTVCFVARKETGGLKRHGPILFTVGRNSMLGTGGRVVVASMEPQWGDHERRGRVGSFSPQRVASSPAHCEQP